MEAVIPERLRRHIAETVLLAPPDHYAAPLSIDPGELRQDFRSFRFDRISELTILRETFSAEPGKTIQDFLKRDTE